MWKLNVFLIPCKNYSDLTYEELLEFDYRITKIDKEENFQIPNIFYDIEDINHQTIYDVIFEEGQTDFSDYLLDVFTKSRNSNLDYEQIKELNDYAYTAIAERDIGEDKKKLSVIDVDDKIDLDKPYGGIIPGDLVKMKRKYLNQCKTYGLFKEKAKICFHRLLFHPDAFIHIARLGRCEEVMGELMRHLCVLNDYGDKIYEYTGKNEKNALLELQSSFRIFCSGKGSKETMMFNKEMVFGSRKYILTCNPHTKLFTKHSGQRIYFCWGRDEIENHKIIIVRIGDHWKE
ncbi:hypothetical protein C818_00575 [Lachnospiraceae bacterium MD308]|jgi:hypothetical protein|nr:hypothetical protein C818_00575 [Lachnospiraceae bacterium MD308]MCI8504551.1 hypothetical protein [Dorea sp.]